MTRVIVVTSGKGGVGKTNISVNIAVDLASRNQRTCLFDADLGLANVNILLGIDPDKKIDDFVFGDSDLRDIIIRADCGIDIIPGSSGIARMADLEPDRLQRIVSALASLDDYDFFIVDTSSGISRTVTSFCLAAPEILLVLTGETTSLTDAYAVLKVLSAKGYNGRVKILVNKCSALALARNIYVHFKTVTDKHLNLDIAPIGAVLTDPNVEAAVSAQQPFTSLFPDSPGSQCLRAIVDNLLKKEIAGNSDWTFAEFWPRFFAELQPAGNPRLDDQRSDRAAEDTVPTGGSDTQVDEGGETTSAVGLVKPAVSSQVSEAEKTIPVAALPVSPVIMHAIAGMLLQNRNSLRELAPVIAAEPVLTAKLMQLYLVTNGDTYKRGTSVEEIAGRLGEVAVMNFITAVFQQAILTEHKNGSDVYICDLARQASCCANLSRAIARHVGYPFPEEAYLGGLFHVLGHLEYVLRRPEQQFILPVSFAGLQELYGSWSENACFEPARASAEITEELGGGSLLADAMNYQGEQVTRVATGFDLTRILYLACRLCYSDATERAKAVKLGDTFFNMAENHLLSIMQGVEQDQQQFVKKHKVSCVEKYTGTEVSEIVTDLKRRILDYMMLQSVFPKKAYDLSGQGGLWTVFQNLYLLFGVQKVFYLRPDSSGEILQATGYKGCFGYDYLAGIVFPCRSTLSFIVKSFNTGTSCVVHASELVSLGDKQIVDRLQADTIVCTPIVRADGSREGVFVLAPPEDGRDYDVDTIGRLERFAAYAGNVC